MLLSCSAITWCYQQCGSLQIHCCRSSLEACREKSLDQVMKAVIVDDITLDNGPWLHMSPEGLDLLQVRPCLAMHIL
jgi:hypothetical protein